MGIGCNECGGIGWHDSSCPEHVSRATERLEEQLSDLEKDRDSWKARLSSRLLELADEYTLGDVVPKALREAASALEAAESRERKLIAALEWYADDDNWHPEWYRADIARKALEETAEGKG